jgi:hypothetical protein
MWQPVETLRRCVRTPWWGSCSNTRGLTKVLVAAVFAALLVMSGGHITPAAAQTARPAVVELFTSQGCSSCPSADALFENFAKRPDVIALSFSVHYWDTLGWKDTLASPRFTERQKGYAKARGDGQVYTPQIVVSGHNHAVGSDKAAINHAISQSQKREPWVPVSIVRTPTGATVEIAPSETVTKDATVWLAAVSRRVEVAVKRGENAGKNLTYFNAVRSFNAIGRYDGKAATLPLDAKALEQSEADQIVVLVQYGTSGSIVGAGLLALK